MCDAAYFLWQQSINIQAAVPISAESLAKHERTRIQRQAYNENNRRNEQI